MMICRLVISSICSTKTITNFTAHRILYIQPRAVGFVYCLTSKLAIKCVVHKIVHRYELIEEIIDNDLVISRVY